MVAQHDERAAGHQPRLLGRAEPARPKLRLGFCQAWYPLFGLLMLASVVLPVVAIVTRTPLMEVGLGEFYHHVAPPMAALVRPCCG